MGSMLVSSCRCCVRMFCVHPVVMRSAVFCTVCNLFVFVSDIVDDQIVLPNSSSVIQMMVVYVLSSVSLDFPQCVVVRAFSICVVFCALSVVFYIRVEKVSLGSNVRASIYIFVCGKDCGVYS